MAPKGAKDNHATAHTCSDIGHRPNRGQWVVIAKSEGSFCYKSFDLRSERLDLMCANTVIYLEKTK
jgi:hypothetical protein